jgi:hypothetical protein
MVAFTSKGLLEIIGSLTKGFGIGILKMNVIAPDWILRRLGFFIWSHAAPSGLINFRISSTRHAVMRGPNLTGWG